MPSHDSWTVLPYGILHIASAPLGRLPGLLHRLEREPVACAADTIGDRRYAEPMELVEPELFAHLSELVDATTPPTALPDDLLLDLVSFLQRASADNSWTGGGSAKLPIALLDDATCLPDLEQGAELRAALGQQSGQRLARLLRANAGDRPMLRTAANAVWDDGRDVVSLWTSAADGGLTVSDHAVSESEIRLVEAHRAPGHPPPGSRPTWERLVERGLLEEQPSIPFGCPDPVDHLERDGALLDAPGPQRAVTEWRDRLAALSQAGPRQRMRERTDLNRPWRNAGLDLPDVELAQSLRWSSPPARLPVELTTGLVADVAPLLTLYMAEPRTRWVLSRRALSRWFADRWESRARVRVDDYYRAFRADTARLDHDANVIDERCRALRESVRESLGTTGGHVHEVPPNRLRSLCDGLVGQAPVPSICSPDLLVAAESPQAFLEGEYSVSVGDLHAVEENLSHQYTGLWVQELFGTFASSVTDAYRTLLERHETVVDVTGHHDENLIWDRVPLPCDVIGLHDHVEFSDGSRGYTEVALRDLTVELGPGSTVRLTDPGGRTLRTMSPLFCHDHANDRLDPFLPFSFPRRTHGLAVPLGDARHLPRLVSGRLVIQRETWLVGGADLRDTATVGALRRRLDLPRLLFVRPAAGRKPVLCDLDSQLSVDELCRKVVGVTDDVTVQEFWPPADGVWLGADRGRHTFEIRCSFVSSPTPGPARGSTVG